MNILSVNQDKSIRYLDHSVETVRGDEVTLVIWGSGDGGMDPVHFKGNIREMMSLFGRITDQLANLSRRAPFLDQDAALDAIADSRENLLRVG